MEEVLDGYEFKVQTMIQTPISEEMVDSFVDAAGNTCNALPLSGGHSAGVPDVRHLRPRQHFTESQMAERDFPTGCTNTTKHPRPPN